MTSVSNDLAGNITTVAGPEGTINYVYDAATGRELEAWTGTSTKSSAVTDTWYGYNAMGQLASATMVKQAGSTPSFTVTSGNYFDATGDSVGTTLPSTLYTYDADGHLIRQVNPNGTETDTDYSSMWTATGVGGVFGTETVINKMTGGTNLSQYVYQFDAEHRKITDLETTYIKDNTGSSGNAFSSTKISWTYDATSRLMSETYDYGNDNATPGTGTHTTDDYTASYSYDKDGKRLTEITDQKNDGSTDQYIAYTYNGQNELSTETATSTPATMPAYATTYTYDANGSMISATRTGSGASTIKYFYDSRNRLIRLDPNGNTTYSGGSFSGTTTDDSIYVYDTDGNRVSLTNSSGTTVYLIDTMNPSGYSQVLEEKATATSTPSTSYLIGLQPIEQTTSGSAGFFMTDVQGSTRLVTTTAADSNGRVVSVYEAYDAFGNAITPPHPTISSTGLTAPNILYTGQYWVSALGTFNLRSRYLRPDLGRYMTMDDPRLARRPGDLNNANLYVYCGGNPINLLDPSGHIAAETALGMAIGLLLVVGFLLFTKMGRTASLRIQASILYPKFSEYNAIKASAASFVQANKTANTYPQADVKGIIDDYASCFSLCGIRKCDLAESDLELEMQNSVQPNQRQGVTFVPGALARAGLALSTDDSTDNILIMMPNEYMSQLSNLKDPKWYNTPAKQHIMFFYPGVSPDTNI